VRKGEDGEGKLPIWAPFVAGKKGMHTRSNAAAVSVLTIVFFPMLSSNVAGSSRADFPALGTYGEFSIGRSVTSDIIRLGFACISFAIFSLGSAVKPRSDRPLAELPVFRRRKSSSCFRSGLRSANSLLRNSSAFAVVENAIVAIM
jgi:hypothetical protein